MYSKILNLIMATWTCEKKYRKTKEKETSKYLRTQ